MMNENENKGNRQKLFFAFIVIAIVLTAILQMLWIPSVQQRILEFGESMIGRSLRWHEKWIRIMKMFAVFGSILLLIFPFCFYEFKIPVSTCEQEIGIKKHGGGVYKRLRSLFEKSQPALFVYCFDDSCGVRNSAFQHEHWY